jgi:serine/threonine protein phosphatase 1
MRTLAIGDIHGCYDALLRLADAVDLQPEDRLITLGDYVDRGPNSREVVDWLIDFQQNGQLIPLIGNHELMMIASHYDTEQRSYWRVVGGAETLESYHPADPDRALEHVPEEHWRFFAQCLPWYETETHIFVHASLEPELELDDQPDVVLFWERFGNQLPHHSGKVMICGHTRQDSGIPANLGHSVCIDTAACASGWLTCLEPATGHYWQATQRGETREGSL